MGHNLTVNCEFFNKETKECTNKKVNSITCIEFLNETCKYKKKRYKNKFNKVFSSKKKQICNF